MSKKSQQNNMKRLGALLGESLGYIYGERDSGPNGAKKEFLSKGAAFFRALAKDLGFTEYNVNTNPAGIAVSGDVCLYGMWPKGGIYVKLSEAFFGGYRVLYRKITHLNDHVGGQNQYMERELLLLGDYDFFVSKLLKLKEETHARKSA